MTAPTAPPTGWRTTAWSGVRLATPADWEPGLLGPDYLRLDGPEGPVAELKWRRVGRGFSPRDQVGRLAKTFRSAGLAERAAPPWWRDQVAALEGRGVAAAPFAWEQGAQGGCGLALRHASAGWALLLQLFSPARPVAAGVLAGLELLPQDGWLPWEVYDWRCASPPGWRLEGFGFQAGRYRLGFVGRGPRGGRLDMLVLAPANVLLAGREWAAWARDYDPDLAKSAWSMVDQGPDHLELARSGWGGGQRARFWRPAGSNKILLAWARGRLAGRPERFGEVCAASGLVA